jgi:hypothetical protein
MSENYSGKNAIEPYYVVTRERERKVGTTRSNVLLAANVRISTIAVAHASVSDRRPCGRCNPVDC